MPLTATGTVIDHLMFSTFLLVARGLLEYNQYTAIVPNVPLTGTLATIGV
jgi:hypothetical protein